MGAQEIGSTWLTNDVHAKIPAAKVAAALQRPEVVNASGTVALIPAQSRPWAGREVQNATRMTNLHSAGITGHSGSRRYGGRIKIGVIEADVSNTNLPVRGHVGWIASEGHRSRIASVKRCSGTGCAATPASGVGLTHGQAISWVATGSIQNGQDSNFPRVYTNDQRDRSGSLRDAYLHYYHVWNHDDGLAQALNQAVADGVDVINMSFGWFFGTACDRNFDSMGVNGTLGAVVAAGVVPVAAAGNGFHNTAACSAWWPGWRTETLAVNGLNGNDFTVPYTSLPLLPDASRGGLQAGLHGGGTASLSTIDVVAPSNLTFVGSAAPNAYDTGTQGGSSIAAPVVTAVIGGLKDAFFLAGFPQNDAGVLMAQALLMGDGFYNTQGMSSFTGAGRVRAHWPSHTDLTAPWGWGWRAVTIHNGWTLEWPVWDNGPESSSVTQWKWAVMWMESNLNAVSDIDFRVVNKCPPGGGEQVLFSDVGYDVRSRFRLGQSDISGRCLFMRAYGYNVAPGGKTLYMADYFHSGAPLDH